MVELHNPSIWFLCGSQHLYGKETLEQVSSNAKEVALALQASKNISVNIEYKALLTTSDEITRVIAAANADENCAGLILWMHTFSPAKMWIRGLNNLKKPFCHLHTQHNRDLPWDTIDMDFMNLNQAAHGDREAGFMHSRMRLNRKVIVGHWSDLGVQQQLGAWSRVVLAWHDLQGARFARFGDNMRFVAVTEGDKVAAEMRFGFSVNGYGIGDLVEYVERINESSLDALIDVYETEYEIVPELQKAGTRHNDLRYAAKVELGLRSFLTQGKFKGFTTTFEDLYGLGQLPGLAVQRLMRDGYGFGAEGDWKTAALVRAMKVMANNQETSFMEDYTYHLEPNNHLVLGSHMLEVCETIAEKKPRLEIHPLGIGGKSDPVRSVFNAKQGKALNASLIDLGNRYRLLINQVEAVSVPAMPNLPVARAVWKCFPDFKTACAAWILAGGAHHTGYSYVVTAEQLEDFAEIAGIEVVFIDENTNLREFKKDLRNNDLYYALAKGLVGS
jgi:L-arabinose isomerase